MGFPAAKTTDLLTQRYVRTCLQYLRTDRRFALPWQSHPGIPMTSLRSGFSGIRLRSWGNHPPSVNVAFFDPLATSVSVLSTSSQTTKYLKSRRSTRPVPVQDQTANRRSTLIPIQRFRILVQKVIHLNIASRHLFGRRLGAEPGIDVRKNSAFLDYGHIMQSYLIEVVDYSSTRSSFRKLARRQPVSTPLAMTMATAMSDTK